MIWNQMVSIPNHCRSLPNGQCDLVASEPNLESKCFYWRSVSGLGVKNWAVVRRMELLYTELFLAMPSFFSHLSVCTHKYLVFLPFHIFPTPAHRLKISPPNKPPNCFNMSPITIMGWETSRLRRSEMRATQPQAFKRLFLLPKPGIGRRGRPM